MQDSTASLAGCVVEACVASADGGGIYAKGSSGLHVVNSSVLASLAARGGGLFAQESLPEVRATLVADNEAQRGGGIFVLSSIRVVVDEVTLRNTNPHPNPTPHPNHHPTRSRCATTRPQRPPPTPRRLGLELGLGIGLRIRVRVRVS